MSEEDRKAKKKEYADAGIKMIVSLFGAEEQPTTEGADPKEVAAAAAKFVQDYDLDGVDVDYEVFLPLLVLSQVFKSLDRMTRL
jgi:chitinase